jgi:hypothetical protein
MSNEKMQYIEMEVTIFVTVYIFENMQKNKEPKSIKTSHQGKVTI